MELKDIKDIVVTHMAGSHAYGTSTPESDIDIRGVFVAPREQICTPFFPIREVTLEDQEDGKMYELNTFMKLYCDMNPNIVETLWVEPMDVISHSPMYWLLRISNEALLSSKVAYTFSGYAISQLKRIKGHDRWLNNPKPMEAPVRRDFMKPIHHFKSGFNMPLEKFYEGYALMHYGNDIYGVLKKDGKKMFNKDGSIHKVEWDEWTEEDKRETPIMIVKCCEEEYKDALASHKQYWEWKANRNVKRHETEIKYGYDTKHAMHLVRLLRMGEEILTGKGVIVKRPDAKELLDIRNGAWEYEDLIKWAEEKDELIRGRLYRDTKLPRSSDIKLAAKLITEIQQRVWW
jgi:hypothetical protein